MAKPRRRTSRSTSPSSRGSCARSRRPRSTAGRSRRARRSSSGGGKGGGRAVAQRFGRRAELEGEGPLPPREHVPVGAVLGEPVLPFDPQAQPRPLRGVELPVARVDEGGGGLAGPFDRPVVVVP